MYKKIFFEISGICQAKCPYCCTGNRSLKPHPSRFIPTHEFSIAIERLFELGLIVYKQKIDLYNWGEPFLHPYLTDILHILVDHGLTYRLSTNAAKYIKLPSHLIDNLTELTISIPGFSQKSYDRVHGFNFFQILENIKRFSNDLGNNKIRITYLVHQFNIHEIAEAYKYFQGKKIKVTDTVAYMNDYNMARDYLSGTLSNRQLNRNCRDLLLYYVDELIDSMPKDYECPQFSFLTIDEYCNVLTCCAVTKDNKYYTLGSIFSLSSDEIKQNKQRQPVCNECQKLGIHYWIHTAPKPRFWGQITGESLRFAEVVHLLNRKIIDRLKLAVS